MSPKRRLFLFFIYVVAAFFGLAFLTGIIWSLFPILGNTLPHHLAEGTGISFQWAAFMVSVLLGLMIVFTFALSVLISTLVADAEQVGSELRR